MGANLSRAAEITPEEVDDGTNLALAVIEEADDSTNLALAVMMSQGAGASPEGTNPEGTNLGVYLRLCKQCICIAYVKQGICVNPTWANLHKEWVRSCSLGPTRYGS